MGQDFPVTAMPVPVFDQLAVVHDGGRTPSLTARFGFRGRLIDSGAVDYLGDEVELRDPLAFCRETYDGRSARSSSPRARSAPSFCWASTTPRSGAPGRVPRARRCCCRSR